MVAYHQSLVERPWLHLSDKMVTDKNDPRWA